MSNSAKIARSLQVLSLSAPQTEGESEVINQVYKEKRAALLQYLGKKDTESKLRTKLLLQELEHLERIRQF